MPTITETLMGRESKVRDDSFCLASSNRPNPSSRTKNDSREEEKVPKEELERVYKVDSFIFNAVNVKKEMIMSAGYELYAKKAAVRKFFEDFLSKVGTRGGDATSEEVIGRIFKDLDMYGEAWDELVWNVPETKILDIKILDPKLMGYARDSGGEVILDEYEKPIGYVQRVPSGMSTKGLGDTPPKGVVLGAQEIFLLPKRIAHFTVNNFGSGFDGIGMIEPAYKATIWKLNLLKAGAESSSKRGFSPVIAKVGNETIHPTPQMIKNILDNIKSLDYSKYMAMPYYVELTTLDIKSIETYEPFLKYLTAMQSAAAGVPVPFITGLGEETNRATLGTQLKVFEVVLNCRAKYVCNEIERYLFKPIADAEGFDEVAEIIWNKITTAYIDEGGMNPNEKTKDEKVNKKKKDTENNDDWNDEDVPDEKKAGKV